MSKIVSSFVGRQLLGTLKNLKPLMLHIAREYFEVRRQQFEYFEISRSKIDVSLIRGPILSSIQHAIPSKVQSFGLNEMSLAGG
jgi:hypothetical protein